MSYKTVFYNQLPLLTIRNKKAPTLQKSEGEGLVLGWGQLFFPYLWLFFAGKPMSA
jgi:hypothetical protein